MKKYLLIILFLLIPWGANAANVVFELNSNELEAGIQYELKVIFDRQDTAVNAIEARIIVPVGIFSDIKIKDGNSAVTMWVQKPELEVTNGVGVINFSAVNPSGINGQLFSILFTGASPSTDKFTFEGNMLLADGKGTRVGLKPQSILISILPTKNIVGNTPNTINYDSDKELPESFEVFVTRDPKIFNNKWFAVFNAQDKNSGISHYEALETNTPLTSITQNGWEKAQSPYLLKFQNPKKFLYIKAVDRSGNYRISKWENSNPTSPKIEHEIKIYVIIILIILLLIGIIFELYLRRHKKKNLKF